VKVVTFNIRHGRKARGWVDIGLLGRTCAAFGADVLALQEVDVRQFRTWFANQPERIAAATGMTSVFGASLERFGGWYGNALLVRGTIDGHTTVRLPQRSREPRTTLLAEARVGAVAFSIAVTHLSTHKQEAAEQLATVVERLRASPAPRLLVGDLNLEPGRVAPIVAQGGLTLVDHAPTFPNLAPRLDIDHVAYDGWRVLGTETPSTPCSDHRPLIVDLEAAPVDLTAAEREPAREPERAPR
jgi:endonuclease/exonuclease/phosphatase family metal-dependent hydrolase